MWDSYLLPEDITPRDAQLVLDFLNRVSSAEELAEAVEFSSELDVGVRVAARILERREQLRGFASLEQLYEVPYVGPERFTEIVVSLSGARPPRTEVAVTGVAEELRELRTTVAALRSALLPTAQVRLWSVQDVVWLGQPINVLAQVTDSEGGLLIDQPVTFTTNWGALNGRSALHIITGASLQTRTDALGMVKLRLFPALPTALSALQQDSLEAQLARLPITAAAPEQALTALRELARAYRADGSQTLRAAIDAYHRQFGSGVLAAERRSGELVSWTLLPATVQCFVHSPAADQRGQITQGLGVHTMQVRNWLGPFLSLYEQQLNGDKRLAGALSQIPTDERFLEFALAEVQAFVALERGALGSELRHHSAERTLTQFVQRELGNFAPELQVDVVANLQAASNTLGTSGLSVFRAIREAPRRTLDLGKFTSRLDALESSVITRSDLQSVQTSLAGQIALKADTTALAADRTRFAKDLVTLDTRVTQLDTDFQNFRR
jgi:hypothetical protein